MLFVNNDDIVSMPTPSLRLRKKKKKHLTKKYKLSTCAVIIRNNQYVQYVHCTHSPTVTVDNPDYLFS